MGDQRRLVPRDIELDGALHPHREAVQGEEGDGVVAAHLEALALERHLGDIHQIRVEVIGPRVERLRYHALHTRAHQEQITRLWWQVIAQHPLAHQGGDHPHGAGTDGDGIEQFHRIGIGVDAVLPGPQHLGDYALGVLISTDAPGGQVAAVEAGTHPSRPAWMSVMRVISQSQW